MLFRSSFFLFFLWLASQLSPNSIVPDSQINFIERIVRRVTYTVYFCKFFKLNYRPASKIRVNMSNDKSYPAKLVASSPDDDLAVLKISANGLNAATYGDSSKLEVGDQVIAIGNPLGQLSNTASTGIISALNRQLTIENRKLNLLQTDASINPGNSGGALFNSSGNLIGIVVAKSAGSDVEGAGLLKNKCGCGGSVKVTSPISSMRMPRLVSSEK